MSAADREATPTAAAPRSAPSASGSEPTPPATSSEPMLPAWIVEDPDARAAIKRQSEECREKTVNLLDAIREVSASSYRFVVKDDAIRAVGMLKKLEPLIANIVRNRLFALVAVDLARSAEPNISELKRVLSGLTALRLSSRRFLRTRVREELIALLRKGCPQCTAGQLDADAEVLLRVATGEEIDAETIGRGRRKRSARPREPRPIRVSRQPKKPKRIQRRKRRVP